MTAKRRKSIDDMVVQRMVRLLRKQGKEEKELMDYIGLQPKSMKNWKYAGSYGYMKYMGRSANFWTRHRITCSMGRMTWKGG